MKIPIRFHLEPLVSGFRLVFDDEYTLDNDDRLIIEETLTGEDLVINEVYIRKETDDDHLDA